MRPPGAGDRDIMQGPSGSRGSRARSAVEGAGAASSGARATERQSHNLPVELSSFIGREREISKVRQLLVERRLVTLTGPGGPARRGLP